MSNQVEIWRVSKGGRHRARHVSWEEDWYRVSFPLLEKKVVPDLDDSGKQKVEVLHVRYGADGKVAEKETGLVFKEVLQPVLDQDGKPRYQVLVENQVDDAFIRDHKEAYAEFIAKNGERKEDERYISFF